MYLMFNVVERFSIFEFILIFLKIQIGGQLKATNGKGMGSWVGFYGTKM